MIHIPLGRMRRRVFLTIVMLSLVGFPCLRSAARELPNDGPVTTAAAGTIKPEAAVDVREPAVHDADLPDSPMPAITVIDEPQGESNSLASNFEFAPEMMEPSSVRVTPKMTGKVRLDQCPYDTTGAKECRVHWGHLAITASAFNAFQNVGNVYTGYWYRWETTHGKWANRWFDSVTGWKWDRWSDSNPFIDDYVGHPMMGAITNSLWIQDDPKGMTLEFGNNRQYWRSRMRAMAFSTAYSFEWKLGPFGEAGVGHNGDHLVPQANGKPWTNETGWVELVTTPVGGLVWTMAEDLLDKHVVKRFEERPRGPISLLAISFLTPARSTANIFRFRPPWYRDGRQVKANTFFSQPLGPDDEAEGTSPEAGAGAGVTQRRAEVLPEWPHYGGVHEFGAWWGGSLMTGHVWGFAKDVKYMPVDVTYSYLLHAGPRWSLRYAPELTALAMLDEPQPKGPDRFNLRRRSYGSGISPVGLRTSFATDKRIQPFLSTDGGFIYFDDRVLSPQGSQFMYTIDFGGGLQIFRKQRQSVSIGYRYQHLSNANISLHNPGTDTNVFYLAVSRFRTKGYR